jgi:hypothetical protein
MIDAPQESGLQTTDAGIELDAIVLEDFLGVGRRARDGSERNVI